MVTCLLTKRTLKRLGAERGSLPLERCVRGELRLTGYMSNEPIRAVPSFGSTGRVLRIISNDITHPIPGSQTPTHIPHW